MKKKKIHRALAIMAGMALTMCSAFPACGTEKKTTAADLVKTYDFSVEKADDFSFGAPKEVKENGKKYKLKDITYEVVRDNRIETVKEVITQNKEDYEKTIEYTLPNGRTIQLVASDPMVNWRECSTERLEKTREYPRKESIPQTITATKPDAEGRPAEVALELASVENATKSESFTAPAAFYSPSENGNRYSFNGKVVSVSASSPTWDGYEDDVKEYLGLSGRTYKINGGTWNGDASFDGTNHVRHATYSGIRTTPLFVATYREPETALCAADITYCGYNGKGKVRAIAEYDRVFPAPDTIKIGAALLLLALAIAAMLFLIGKKRKAGKQTK